MLQRVKQFSKEEFGIHWWCSIGVESLHSIKFPLAFGVTQTKIASESGN